MSIGHWVVVAVVVLLLFGRGKISDIMGDFAKGIRSFKKGLNEDDDTTAPVSRVENKPAATVIDPVKNNDQPKV